MDLNILGVGPLELVFFVVLLLLLFGPNDLVRIARNLGRFINRVTRSENYQAIQQASREIRTLPERILQEADLPDLPGAAQPPAAAAARPTVTPPARPAAPALSAWTQELPNPPAAPAPPAAGNPALKAWTQELPPEPPPGAPPAAQP